MPSGPWLLSQLDGPSLCLASSTTSNSAVSCTQHPILYVLILAHAILPARSDPSLLNLYSLFLPSISMQCLLPLKSYLTAQTIGLQDFRPFFLYPSSRSQCKLPSFYSHCIVLCLLTYPSLRLIWVPCVSLCLAPVVCIVTLKIFLLVSSSYLELFGKSMMWNRDDISIELILYILSEEKILKIYSQLALRDKNENLLEKYVDGSNDQLLHYS